MRRVPASAVKLTHYQRSFYRGSDQPLESSFDQERQQFLFLALRFRSSETRVAARRCSPAFFYLLINFFPFFVLSLPRCAPLQEAAA